MMNITLWLAIILSFGIYASALNGAEKPSAPATGAKQDAKPVSTERIKELISQLANEKWKEASKELIESADEAATPLLEEAVKGTDKTIARRAGIVLRKIAYYKLASKFEASPVTLTVKDEPLKKVLDAIEAQTGNKIGRSKSIKDSPISIDLQNVCFWAALDAVCRSSGNIYGEDPSRSGG
jgi:hypothetical protein